MAGLRGLCVPLVLVCIAATASPVLAQCPVPNVLTNGQVADASQVMDNFNAVAACSDAAVTTTATPTTGSIAVFTGPKSVSGGNLSGDVTTSGGTATTLSTTGVVPGTSTGATIVVDAKGRITYAGSGAVGGGGSWTTVYSNASIANPTANIIVDVTSYNDVLVIGRGVTSAVSGYRGVELSVDNGTTFFNASGNYEAILDTGVASANFVGLNHNSKATGGRSFGGIIYGMRIPGVPKFMQNTTADAHRWFVGSYNPITHIKVTVIAASAGPDIAMTGGEVYVLGR